MRYMLLIYATEPVTELSPEARQAKVDQVWSVIDRASEAGVLRAVEPLEPARTATTIRLQNGEPVATDGPYAETKEHLAGYYILDCKDVEQAIHWASQHPIGCNGGTGYIEIRAIGDLPQRSKLDAEVLAEAI